jgi:amino acid permease
MWLVLIYSQWYGRIEVVLGILKITFVVGTFLVMLIINNTGIVPMHPLACT